MIGREDIPVGNGTAGLKSPATMRMSDKERRDNMSRWINEKWLSAKINEDSTYKKSNSVRNKPLVFIISVIVYILVNIFFIFIST